LVPVPGGDRVPTPAPEMVEAARGFAATSRAASTRRTYAAAWCRAAGHAPLPAHPAVVAGNLGAEAVRGVSPAWMQLQLSAIGWVHRRAGGQPAWKTVASAVIAEILAGIRRAHGRPPTR
jgi:hypothetical protein